jgi:hypothetical protein
MDERLEQLTNQILATKKITQEALEKKVAEKLSSLGGLISEEGALHIVANDLGIALGTTPAPTSKLKDVLAGMKNVSVIVKVLRKYELRTFGQDGKGKVGSLFVGDETGFMRLTFWNDKTTYFETIAEGDVVEIQSAYSKENNDRVELHMGNTSHCIVNPEGKTVTVKERAAPEETPIKKIGDIDENDTFVQILATIVQAFPPRYFERTIDGKSTTNYVMNIQIDDESGNLRATLWKEQLLALLKKTDEEVLAMQDNADAWKAITDDLLGTIISARARVKINEQFNTKELVLYNVNPEPKPPLTASNAAEQSKTSAVTDSATTQKPKKEDQTPSPEQVTEELIGDDDEELLSIDDIDELD